MKVLLLGGLSTNPEETAKMEEYVAYFSSDGTDVSFTHFDFLSFVVDKEKFVVFDHKNNILVDAFDLVIFRGKVRANSELAYCVSRYCSIKGVKFFNDYTAYRAPTKLVQAITLHELGLPTPVTVYSKDQSILVSVVQDTLDFPKIIKSSVGSHGDDNFLARNEQEVDQILHDNKDLSLIIQSFFPNKCDYRILCMGPRELVIRRTATGDTHLNNTSQGGSAELVEPGFIPYNIIQQAHEFADKVNMQFAGVDLLYNEETGDYVFLEINSQPQLTDGAFPKEKQKLLHEFLNSLDSN